MCENGSTVEFPDPLPADLYEKHPKSRKRPADRKQKNLKYDNNNNNNKNDNNNNIHLKRVTQSNGRDLPLGPLACLQVARGPQGYKVVEYIDFRYRDLKEGRDSAHLITSVKPFPNFGPCI